MKPEIEAKFLAVDHDVLRTKLESLGAECVQPMRLMKRKNYDFPDGRLDTEKHAWVRVRDEGDKITMSYKQMNDLTLHGTHEVCVTVDSFEAADAFLQAIGLQANTYQETRRESWRLDEFEIELDEWPWAAPYAELEGPDEQALRALAVRLGLDWEKVRYGGVWSVYDAEYDVEYGGLNVIPVITFDAPAPEWLAKRRHA